MKINKKFIISLVIIFALVNLILYSISFAGGATYVVNYMKGRHWDSTTQIPDEVIYIIRVVLAIAQVGITGYVLIRLTIVGIRYFSSAATGTDMANLKIRLKNLIIFGGLGMVLVNLIGVLYDAFAV